MLNKLRKPGFFTLLAVTMAMLFITGCNTIKGAGKDIENTGDNIQDAAD